MPVGERDRMKQVILHVPESLIRRVKVAAAMEDRTIRSVVAEALGEWLAARESGQATLEPEPAGAA